MTQALEFVRGFVKEKDATNELENILTGDPELAAGKILYGYPIFTPMGKPSMSPGAVIVAPNGQVTIIHICQAPLPENHREIQDNCFMAVYRKLGANQSMRNGRNMRVNMQTLSFVPDLPESDLSDEEYPVVNRHDLGRVLREYRQKDSDNVDGEQVATAIMSSNSETGFW